MRHPLAIWVLPLLVGEAVVGSQIDRLPTHNVARLPRHSAVEPAPVPSMDVNADLEAARLRYDECADAWCKVGALGDIVSAWWNSVIADWSRDWDASDNGWNHTTGHHKGWRHGRHGHKDGHGRPEHHGPPGRHHPPPPPFDHPPPHHDHRPPPPPPPPLPGYDSPDCEPAFWAAGSNIEEVAMKDSCHRRPHIDEEQSEFHGTSVVAFDPARLDPRAQYLLAGGLALLAVLSGSCLFCCLRNLRRKDWQAWRERRARRRERHRRISRFIHGRDNDRHDFHERWSQARTRFWRAVHGEDQTEETQPPRESWNPFRSRQGRTRSERNPQRESRSRGRRSNCRREESISPARDEKGFVVEEATTQSIGESSTSQTASQHEISIPPPSYEIHAFPAPPPRRHAANFETGSDSGYGSGSAFGSVRGAEDYEVDLEAAPPAYEDNDGSELSTVVVDGWNYTPSSSDASGSPIFTPRTVSSQ